MLFTLAAGLRARVLFPMYTSSSQNFCLAFFNSLMNILKYLLPAILFFHIISPTIISQFGKYLAQNMYSVIQIRAPREHRSVLCMCRFFSMFSTLSMFCTCFVLGYKSRIAQGSLCCEFCKSSLVNVNVWQHYIYSIKERWGVLAFYFPPEFCVIQLQSILIVH